MPYVSGVPSDDQEVTLYVEDVGAGHAVVMLHPWPLTSQAWELQVSALVEAGFRVVSFDRRGFGRSSRPWGGYDYPTLAADLHAVVTSRGLASFSVIAASMGGGEVVEYVRAYGDEQLHAVVLASSILPAIVTSLDNPDGAMTALVFEDYLSAARDYRLAFLDEVVTSSYSVRGELVIEERARQFALRCAADASPRAITECALTWAGADLRAALATTTVPTLVVHGAEDALFPARSTALRTHGAIPAAQLLLIADAPHGCNVSHSPQFNAAVVAFLRHPH